MEVKSTHWADVLNWLEKIVFSCQTREQAISCLNLVEHYETMFQKQIGYKTTYDLLRPLRAKLLDLEYTFN